MADGRWQMADGKWQMADGKLSAQSYNVAEVTLTHEGYRWPDHALSGIWQMADGRWQKSGQRGITRGQRFRGIVERVVGLDILEEIKTEISRRFFHPLGFSLAC